ncbi:MAG: ATP-binding protein [Alphaproteobacteria bacterium]|jgi:signal transduction histidine kinase|nr:ATP-binding protein [Alphaproteobacteria bacterium]MDP6620748.1 ATP-binding protein [Alphaproteobacteria bacterium]HJP21248.1 ATP-binding protein [Alphaproteobacteria bacterium]
MLNWLLPGIVIAFVVLAGLGFLLLWRSQALLTAFILETKEREKAEEAVRQYQKLESLSTLAGGLAHNFNNLLVPILALGSRLLRETPETNPHKAALGQIIRAAERARDLVHLVRSFGRRSEALLDTIDLPECVGETVQLLRVSVPSDITLNERIDADTGRVVADPTQIATMVMNLASNALDAIAKVEDRIGGEVTIILDRVEVDKEAVAANPDLVVGPHARLEISDNGTRMAPAVSEQVFDPFFTTKDPDRGTGLGLSTTHGIVSRHGGTIKARSELGRGTCFEIYLPLAESPTAAAD